MGVNIASPEFDRLVDDAAATVDQASHVINNFDHLINRFHGLFVATADPFERVVIWAKRALAAFTTLCVAAVVALIVFCALAIF